MNIGSILVLVQTGIMVIIIIIFKGGVIWDIFQMSLIKARLLHFMVTHDEEVL
jgi:hypothetical protein